jgi:hypothetical protein
MTDSAKPAPRVIRRDNDNVSKETRVAREIESDSEVFSTTLSNGRVVTLREMNAGDLLYLEKSLGNAGDMERSLKLTVRLSCEDGRVTYDDLQRLKMKDLRLVTALLGEAGGTEEEDEDEFPND